MEGNAKADSGSKKTYFGRRGNEIVIVDEYEDKTEVKIILVEGRKRDLTTLKYCTIPRQGADLKIEGGKLLFSADIPDLLKIPKSKRGEIQVGCREDVLWPEPDRYYNLDNEEDAQEWEEICKIKKMIEEYETAPDDELYDAEVTVISDGAYGKFNCMKSMEDGYEKVNCKRIDDSSENANPIRKLNAKYLGASEDEATWDFDLKEIGAEYMTLLKELAASGELNGITADDIKFAMMFAFERRRGFDDSREDERQELIQIIKELLSKREIQAETKELWARGLFNALYDFEVSEYVSELHIKDFNRVYFKAMEKDADETPSSKLMSWYKEGLQFNNGYSKESKMYNRLAYFYLQHYANHDNLKQARAYFTAMERRGIEFENPYENFYGNNRHGELIDALIEGKHEEDFDLYLEEYFKRVKE